MIRPLGKVCFGIVLACVVGTVAEAQTIGECPENPVTTRRSACPDGWRFGDGDCHHSNWMGHRMHCRLADCNTCRDDEELIAATGECLTRGVLVRSGTPACPAGWRFEDGDCHHRNWIGYMMHCRLQDCSVCREDQMLDVEHGLCCDIPF